MAKTDTKPSDTKTPDTSTEDTAADTAAPNETPDTVEPDKTDKVDADQVDKATDEASDTAAAADKATTTSAPDDAADTSALDDAPVKTGAGTAADGNAGGAWARLRSKAVLPRATVAVLLLGSAVTAGLQWHQADQASRRDAERRAIKASAADFGQALLSYDHTKLQAARNRVLALASDDFAKTYDEAFTGGLEGVITKLKADATATVRTVYLGDVGSGTARAVVVMDSEVRSTAGTRRVLGSYLDMRLARHGKKWQVIDVTSIGAANESMVDPQGRQQPSPTATPSPNP
ncbi:hypothetical protein [Actinomadura fibrosa]|uniref:Mce-associated membrane protein n=1 Tax=Actinomadura fibrosa TaxID=111802 RepID=A0ABW2XET8_9ACTN|nr:hypothetical protein [Actinomadura fibrosa]